MTVTELFVQPTMQPPFITVNEVIICLSTEFGFWPPPGIVTLLTESAGQAGLQEPSAGSHVSFAAHLGANTHPLAGSQESTVQALLSLQSTGVLMTPVAGSHDSIVQALWSSALIGVLTHPDAGLQESVVQALPSLQLTGVLTQPVAESHVSMVQALLSLQLINRNTHWPVAGSQESVVQALLSLHVIAV